MEFNDWVDKLGGVEKAAELLGETKRNVASWYYAERAPRLGAAVNIIQRSEYAVDFNGIYWPIARRLFGLERPKKPKKPRK